MRTSADSGFNFALGGAIRLELDSCNDRQQAETLTHEVWQAVQNALPGTGAPPRLSKVFERCAFVLCSSVSVLLLRGIFCAPHGTFQGSV